MLPSLHISDMRVQSEQGIRHSQLVDELLDSRHRNAVDVLPHLPGGRPTGASGVQVIAIRVAPPFARFQLTLITYCVRPDPRWPLCCWRSICRLAKFPSPGRAFRWSSRPSRRCGVSGRPPAPWASS